MTSESLLERTVDEIQERRTSLTANNRLRFTLARDLKLARPDWLIRGYLERDSLALIFGVPASGKSFLALDMAASIASGRDWADADTAVGPVLYLAGEGRAGITRRLAAWSIRTGVPRESLDIAISNGPARLCDPDGIADLEAAVSEFVEHAGAPRLLVVDTLARSFGGGDENSNTDMSAAISALDRIKAEHGCAILLVHHSGHNAQDRARGASALFAAVDTAVRVGQDDDRTVRAEWTKSKDAELPDPLAYKLRQVELPIHDDRGEPLTSAVLDQVHYEAPAKPQRKGGGKHQRRALELLRDLQERHERNVMADGRDPSDARVTLRDWRQAMIDDGISRSSAYLIPDTLHEAGEVRIAHGFVKPLQSSAVQFVQNPAP